jgi:predicted nucleic acid-binding protein
MAGRTFYLETSVWGSLAPRQPRDRAQVVRRLLQLLDGIRGECVISDVVLAEIHAAPQKTADQVFRHVERVQPLVFPIDDDMEALAQAYIAADVLPKRRESDAMHIAAATCLELDYLVSWNHRHMTRPMKRLQYEAVNRLHGFLKTPMICNPFEACDELRDR